MTPIAVISDIHANVEALDAILSALERWDVGDIYCLGDVVGYGPDPAACMERCLERCAVVLAGNHEEGLLDPDAAPMNAVASQALAFSRSQIAERGLLDAVADLPTHHRRGDHLMVHASIQGRTHGYLLERSSSGRSTFDRITRFIERRFVGFRVCYVGHNHVPFLATREGFIHPHDGRTWFYSGDERFFVSVGSVGQPRDGDPRACCVVYDGTRIHFVRVPYDHQVTRDKMIRRGLPSPLAARLARGR